MQRSGQTTTTTYETEAGNVAQLITTSLLSLYESSLPPKPSHQQMAFLVSLLFLALFVLSSSANFYKDVNPIFGGQRCKIVGNGNLLTLSLDRASGSGFQSKREYLFGRVDMQMKLVPGNSAGTVTTLYLSSQGPTHDEVDFEFLGNSSGDPYVLHTNIFTQGKGNREQRFYLWFDPRLHFHTYSILWNQKNIILLVDGTPIRVFRNAESIGVPYPKNQPMRLYSTLWNADDWATRGGLVKTDWSKAPFVASYRAFSVDACIWSGRRSSCSVDTSKFRWGHGLDASGRRKLNWVRRNYMIYDYCKDTARFPKGVPRECYLSPRRERETA